MSLHHPQCKRSRRFALPAGILLIFALPLLLASSCSEEKSIFVGVKGWMSDIEFSKDGNYLIAISGHVREDHEFPGTYFVHRDTISLFEVGTWKMVMEHATEATIWSPYSCADPDVIIYSECPYPSDVPLDLVFRSVSTGAEINRLAVDDLPSSSPKSTTYYCDLERNIVYMVIFNDKITVLNGSTGEVLKEYLAQNVGFYAPFVLQEEKDRLVRIDHYEDIVWIYRLSTAELLGTVEMWPYWREVDLSVEHLFPDDDHLLYVLEDSRDGPFGVYLVTVDLVDLAVEAESFIPDRKYSNDWMMESNTSRVLMNVHNPYTMDGYTVVVDFRTGQVEHQLDLSWLGQGEVFPIPEIGRIYIDDWRTPGGASARVYSYPDFELLHIGKAPVDSEEKQWVSDGQFIAMESYFSDRFGVYDPASFRVLDAFHLCTNVGANSMRIDPSGRWAAVKCYGTDPALVGDTYNLAPGMYPRNGGVAVVDLDRYR